MPSKSPSHRINRNSTRSSPCSQPDSPCHARESARFVIPHSIELDKSRRAYIDPTETRVTISDWMDVWAAARPDLRSTSRTRATGIINTHIRPRLGPIQIGQFTRLQAQLWAAGIPGSPKKVRKFVNVLTSALQLAVDDGRLPANLRNAPHCRSGSRPRSATCVTTRSTPSRSAVDRTGASLAAEPSCTGRIADSAGTSCRACASGISTSPRPSPGEVDRRHRQGLAAHRGAEGLRAPLHPDPGVPRHRARAAGCRSAGITAGQFRDAHQDLLAQPCLSQGLVRPRCYRDRTRQDHAPRKSSGDVAMPPARARKLSGARHSPRQRSRPKSGHTFPRDPTCSV